MNGISLVSCVHCDVLYNEGEEPRDIQLCSKCIPLFDLDKLWEDHDDNQIDAMDFNCDPIIREQYYLHLDDIKMEMAEAQVDGMFENDIVEAYINNLANQYTNEEAMDWALERKERK